MPKHAARVPVPAGCPLHPGQFQCLALLAKGLSHEQIAVERGVAASTVRSHLSASYKLLGVANGVQAVAVMYDAGWLDTVASEHGDDRLSPAQGLYLRSFDRLLALRHTDSATLYFAVLKEMTHHLRAMYYEIDRLPPWEVLGAPRPPGPVRQHSRRARRR